MATEGDLKSGNLEQGGGLNEADALLQEMGVDTVVAKQVKKSALEEKVGERNESVVAGKIINAEIQRLEAMVKAAKNVVADAQRDSLPNLLDLQKKLDRLNQIVDEKKQELVARVNEVHATESDSEVVDVVHEQAHAENKERDWSEINKLKELVDQRLRAIADCWRDDGGFFLAINDENRIFIKKYKELEIKKKEAESAQYAAEKKFKGAIFFKGRAENEHNEAMRATSSIRGEIDALTARNSEFRQRYSKLYQELKTAYDALNEKLAYLNIKLRQKGRYAEHDEWKKDNKINCLSYEHPHKTTLTERGNLKIDIRRLFQNLGYDTQEIE